MLRTLVKDSAVAFHKAYTSTAYQWDLAMFEVGERFAKDFNGVRISVDALQTGKRDWVHEYS